MKTSHAHIAFINSWAAVIAVLMALTALQCGNTPQQQTRNTIDYDDTEGEPARRNPAFMLFESEGSYHLYRNSDKIASFALTQGRKPIDICAHNGDSYILISESKQKDSTNAEAIPAEILKNGRKAMIFDEAFKAISFNMDDGHFYVLGRLGDSVNTVYRDGLRALSFPVRQDSRPVDLFVFQQSIYVAMQRGKSVDIYKDNNKIYTHPGTCRDLKVSLRGMYMLAHDSLYHDDALIMHSEYYRNAHLELFAVPTLLEASATRLFTGGRSSFDKTHTYACTFLDQQPYATIKPDEKTIGESELNTRCCGIAMSGETMYYVSENLTPDMEPVKPTSFRFFMDHDEMFSIQFGDKPATLLMMASD
jgi:hypothetical protein